MAQNADPQVEITVTHRGRLVHRYSVPASKVAQQWRIWGSDLGTGRKRYQLAVRAL